MSDLPMTREAHEIAVILREYAGWEPGEEWVPTYLDVGIDYFAPWLVERLKEAGWEKRPA